MNVEIAYEKILSSVKRRFDYLQYEEDFIDALGTEKGAMMAANLVRETMIGLADGKKVEDIAADLNAQLACLGLSADATSQCSMIAAASKKEVSAFVMLRVYTQMGMNTDEAFLEVKKDLVCGYTEPTEEDRAALEEDCMSQIISSAKKAIPMYDDCLKDELSKRPSKAERRLDTIVRVSLGLFSAVGDVDLDKIHEYLVGMMEKGTEPKWLIEFLQDAKESVGKELCAMNAMNIGWERKMPIKDISSAIRYRLEH